MDYKKERHNEINRLYYKRKREWKQISKIYLEILLDDRIEKVYKTEEEKKKTMLKCVNNWVENNREKYNSYLSGYMNNKNRWKSISNIFLKILL